MNDFLEKINQESILFFDIECVRRSEELKKDTKEYELYMKKTRNRDTDEFLLHDELVEDYAKRAALKMGYQKIVSIGVGFIRKGDVYIKHIDGEEEDILKEFFNLTNHFDYLCGHNIIGFDLPICLFNAARYFNPNKLLKPAFNTSGKKPWELKSILDTMDIIKGTHFSNISLSEALYHFGIEDSKDDIDGSQVSQTYYTEGVDKINIYVKKDVFAVVNLFRALTFQDRFVDFIDRNSEEGNEEKMEFSPLKYLYNCDRMSDEVKEVLKNQLLKSGKKPTKKEVGHIREIIESVYIRTEFMKEDKPDVVEAKKAEVSNFLKELGWVK